MLKFPVQPFGEILVAGESNGNHAALVKPVDIHACLADPTRFRMVHLLLAGPLCVKHFQAVLGLSQVTTSKHLAYLKRRSLVEVRRNGTLRVYSLPAVRDGVLTALLRSLAECAAADPVCLGDQHRRQLLAEEIQRDVTGHLRAVQPRRTAARVPEVTAGQGDTWPSVDDGPLLD